MFWLCAVRHVGHCTLQPHNDIVTVSAQEWKGLEEKPLTACVCDENVDLGPPALNKRGTCCFID